MIITKTPLIFFVCAALLCWTTTFSQGMKFEKGNFQQVRRKAERQQKCIFLQFESASCDECNVVANKAFSNPQLAEYFQERFIALLVNPTSREGIDLANKYSVSLFPTSLFLNEKGDLLYEYNGSTTNVSDYFKYANIALSHRNEKPLIAFEKEYNEGNKNLSFLKSYIIKRKEISQPVDSLLDEYVSLLPEDSLSSFNTISFVLQQAPLVDSKAFDFITSHEQTMAKVYRSMNFRQASSINNEIISRSLQKAINEKNQFLAIDVSKFTQRTWGYDRVRGQKAANFNLLEYYKGIKDTAAYIDGAVKYYDNYYMSKNLDSLKAAAEAAFQTMLKTLPGDTIKTDSGFIVKRIVRTTNTQFEYSNSLNGGAWSVFKFARNKNDLEKALTWAKRALEYQEMPGYMDTYAHLLYKLHRKKEAISWEQKAIDIITSKSKNTIRGQQFQNELEKMRNNTL